MRSALLVTTLVSSLAYAATDVSHAAVVVVRGSADHLDQVLARAKISFVAVSPDELPELALNARQVLMESPEAAKLFGSGNIAARFAYEDGQVIHVTGHFFSQPGQKSQAVAKAAAAVTMGQGGGAVARGEKLKVLEKAGEFVRVRDQQGNEGYVPADAL